MQGASGHLLSCFVCQYLVRWIADVAVQAVPLEDQSIGRFFVNAFKVQPWRMTNHYFMGLKFAARSADRQ
jgi:hypothetical protein